MHRKTYRARVAKYGLIVANAALLGGVTYFALQYALPSKDTSVAVLAARAATQDESIVNPLDQLSSADIAVHIARAANMPEQIPITNQADSMNVELAMSSAGDTEVVRKPQVVNTVFKTKKDIQTYKVQPGDTVAGIAAKFKVTSDSIRWSNAITSGDVRVGDVLSIPPINGIVYVVRNGDTPDSLASRYSTSKEKIIAYNDAELTGLKTGDKILIPDGRQPAPVVVSSYGYGFRYSVTPVYGYNGYDYGYCTWYVANKVSVPANWGNANTWDDLAPSSGWNVSGKPRVGAVAQSDRGSLGHVGVVTAVSPDGSMIKYADMNGIAGWGREGFSDWVPVSKYDTYIYR